MLRATIIGTGIIGASFAAAALGWLGDWAAVAMAFLGAITAFGIERYGSAETPLFSIGQQDTDGD